MRATKVSLVVIGIIIIIAFKPCLGRTLLVEVTGKIFHLEGTEGLRILPTPEAAP